MMAPKLFDHSLLRLRFRRAQTLGAECFLLDRAAADLSERLATLSRRFDCVADVFTPFARGRQTVIESGKAAAGITFAPAHDAVALRNRPAVVSDEELLPLQDQAIDLAVSLLALQNVNDLPGMLAQIRRALRPDGLFLGAMLGGDTLTELRQAFAAAELEIDEGISPRVAPFADVREIGGLLQRAGFALPVADLERVSVRYSSVFGLLRDLRRMGATNALVERRRAPLKRSVLLRMAEIYAARFSDPDAKVRATFDVIWLSGWAPHESQQQPLPPGSARMPLAQGLAAARRARDEGGKD